MLAVLGQNDTVDRAVGKRPVQGRGLRVLALDGGGMKGMTEVTMLRELERRTGASIRDLFDVRPMHACVCFAMPMLARLRANFVQPRPGMVTAVPCQASGVQNPQAGAC